LALCLTGISVNQLADRNMTADELIEEGRRIQRPCVFLRPSARGEVAAIWRPRVDAGVSFRPWLSVDTRFIPGFDATASRFVTISTNEGDCVSGRVDVVSALPDGEALYAYEASVLPPIDAVFACGSEAVEEWLQTNQWSRNDRYNDNFAGSEIVREYEQVWMREFPLYSSESDVYAILGGWHGPNADDDWHELISQRLLAMTLHESEPWVEAWQIDARQFRVIQRVT
jgi:hypothetical protein